MDGNVPHSNSWRKKLKLLRFLWGYWRQELPLIAISSLVMIAASILQLSIPISAKRLVQLPPMADIHELLVDVVLVMCSVLGYHAVSFGGHLLAHRATLKVSSSMQKDGLATIIESEWLGVVRRNSTEITQTIVSAARVSSDAIATIITEIVTSLFAAIGILAAVLYISWELTFVFLGIVVLSQLLFASPTQHHGSSSVAGAAAADQGQLVAYLQNSINRLSTIQLHQCDAWIKETFQELCARVESSGRHLNFDIHFHAAISSAATNCLFVVMAAVAAYLESHGHLSLTDIGIFFFYMKQLLDRILSVVSEVKKIGVVLLATTEFHQMMTVANRRPHNASSDPGSPLKANHAVVLEGVSFSYDEPVSVLGSTSLWVKQGEIIALSGPSGCGKSTILRIIAGLVRPVSGRVSRHSNNVAMLEQQPAILIGTVRQNIAIGWQKKTPCEDADIQQAATKAGCEVFISRLPRGYDTVIENADAAQFSGGQLQRICLARIFLSDAQLVLLDEPTTGLDAVVAESILSSILRLHQEGRTVIFASHDPRAIRIAQKEIVV